MLQALRSPVQADAPRVSLRHGACRRGPARGGLAPVRAGGHGHEEEDSGDAGESFDARAFRRQLGQSGNYTRKHQRDEDAAKAMEAAGVGAVSAGAVGARLSGDSGYAASPNQERGPRLRLTPAHPPVCPPCLPGGLISQMKTEGFRHVRGNVTLQLAQSYGFCWGVERAVQMAYEARKQYPQEKLWITNEIIHNPSVNQARLLEGGCCEGGDTWRQRPAALAPRPHARPCVPCVSPV